MKRGKLEFVILSFFVLIAVVSFASAAAQSASISPTTGQAGVYQLYNITLQNLDTVSITMVNITSPVEVTGTVPVGTSTNANISAPDPQHLIFANLSAVLIAGGATGYFWLNATTSQVGIFNIDIYSMDSNNSTINSTSVTINISNTTDTSGPIVVFVPPTNSTGSTLNTSYIQVNVTASDSSSGLKNITIFLYNSSRILIDSSTSLTSPFFHNFTSLGEGTYYINATAYDTLNNMDFTSTRTIELDTGPSCITNWTCTWGECANNIQSQICSDLNSCGVTTGKPNGTQACVSCVTEWNCTGWAPVACSSGSNQTRICTDLSDCAEPTIETRTCVITSNANALGQTLPLFSSSFLFFGILGVIVLSIAGVFFALARMKKKSASSNSSSDDSGYTTYPPRGPPPPAFPPPGYANPPRVYPNQPQRY